MRPKINLKFKFYNLLKILNNKTKTHNNLTIQKKVKNKWTKQKKT